MFKYTQPINCKTADCVEIQEFMTVNPACNDFSGAQECAVSHLCVFALPPSVSACTKQSLVAVYCDQALFWMHPHMSAAAKHEQ